MGNAKKRNQLPRMNWKTKEKEGQNWIVMKPEAVSLSLSLSFLVSTV